MIRVGAYLVGHLFLWSKLSVCRGLGGILGGEGVDMPILGRNQGKVFLSEFAVARKKALGFETPDGFEVRYRGLKPAATPMLAALHSGTLFTVMPSPSAKLCRHPI
jgi:hypothetical protein